MSRVPPEIKIRQRGVQLKQGAVICMLLFTSLLYDTSPIHCTPLPLHLPAMNTHETSQRGPRARRGHSVV